MMPLISLIVAVVGLIVSSGVTITLFRINATIRRFERMEDGKERAIGALQVKFETSEGRVHEMTQKLVDERVRNMTHDVRTEVDGLIGTIQEIKQELKDGDVTFEQLADRNQKIELAVAGKFDALKDQLRETVATKKDIEKHEVAMGRVVEKLQEGMTTISRNVAILSDRVGGLSKREIA